MEVSWLRLFIDPLFQTITIGSLLVCMFASFMGSFIFVKKRSLLAETISHAAYPGLIIGIVIAASLSLEAGFMFQATIIAVACFFSFLGLKTVFFLEKRFSFSADSALCFVLASFFGLGILLASRLQFTQPVLYQRIQIFLYGQAATLSKDHIILYSILMGIAVIFVARYYTAIKIAFFDETFSVMSRSAHSWLEGVIFLLTTLAIVLGLRNVGVVLMAGMMIAPAIFARSFTKSFGSFMLLSVFVGGFSSLLGIYFSINGSYWLQQHLGLRWVVATGPLIVLVASFFALFALFFGFRRGIAVEWIRRLRFSYLQFEENMIKLFFYGDKKYTSQEIIEKMGGKSWIVFFFLQQFIRRDWIVYRQPHYFMTSIGEKKAKRIVRKHRLWERFLYEKMGKKEDQIHESANEMEHIISENLERSIKKVLRNPTTDPHNQAIPEEDE